MAENFYLITVPQALQGYLQRYQIQPRNDYQDATQFLIDSTIIVKSLLRRTLNEIAGFKLQLRLQVRFVKDVDVTTTADAYFNSSQLVILPGTDINDSLRSAKQDVKMEAFQQRGSGWTVESVRSLDVHIARYELLIAGTYMPLPKYLASKKAIVNPKNPTDNFCFVWSVLAALYPQGENEHRINKYKPYFQCIDTTCLSFPVALTQIPAFELANKLSISVFGFKDSLYPLYQSCQTSEKHINLLLLTNDRNSHYCYIKDMNKLLYGQNRHKARKYFCRNCLFPFPSSQRVESHQALCEQGLQSVVMPEIKDGKKPTLKFTHWDKAMRLPYVLYADFECILEPIESCDPKCSTSFTLPYQQHSPCSFGIVGLSQCCRKASPSYERPVIYRGTNVVEEFLAVVLEKAKLHQELLDSRHRNHSLTQVELCDFNEAQNCHICGCQFSLCESCSTGVQDNFCFKCEVIGKVKDHCHMCGVFRGAAQRNCNLDFRIKRDVLVFFHNLRRYDSHLIMQRIGKVANALSIGIKCVPKGMEDYLTFSLQLKHSFSNGKSISYRVRFLDTYQFLPSSLGSLVDNLAKKGSGCFSVLSDSFPDTSNMELLLRKGVYPYEYVDCVDKSEENCLPSIASFYSSLTGESVSPADYEHAKTVWASFNIENLGEYHDLYLKTDVLLLADVFENFRSFSLNHYNLDPAHFITLPSLAWTACLKLSKVSLELLADPDMYIFLEQGIRGGISTIAHRFAQANNAAVPQNFNPSNDLSWLIYLDANNLYGWTMTQNLPENNFCWLGEEEIANFDLSSTQEEVGYILEVDLEYPQQLHDIHNDYPLAAEKLEVDEQMLSPFCSQMAVENQLKRGITTKLIPNLQNKYHYIVHVQNLKLYLQLGLKLAKIHRVLAFRQSPWMRTYIVFNTEMRKKAVSDFEKDMFKLLNNAVFGKSMENVRTYVDIELVTKPERFRKLVANPRYEESVDFGNDLIAVKMKRTKITLDKPIYVGFTVLDLSKYLMYDFHYNYIVTKYQQNAKLLFTDTDSLCYQIKTENIYDDLAQDLGHFDTSDYPSDHPLFSVANKKVMGKMKGETAGIPIEEFVGLRSKMYSLRYNQTEKKRAKGVSKAVVKKTIRHENYLQALWGRKQQHHIMNSIRSINHQLYSVKCNKVSLCAFDDKRYVCDDGISTLAYGHYKIALLN